MSKLFKKTLAAAMSLAMVATMSSVSAFAAGKASKTIGSSAEVGKSADPNNDRTVWVNGKDVKASKDGSTPAVLYKTESFDVTGMYSGGKWTVAVTAASVSESAFVTAVNANKGKLPKTGDVSDAKSIASAKIKDGVVTVTAGKDVGEAKVWVYEVKKGLASDKKSNGVVYTDTIKPICTTIAVKNSNPNPLLSDKETVASKSDVTKAIELAPGATKVYTIATDKTGSDKKIIAPDAANTYTVKVLKGKTEATGITATLNGNKVTIAVASTVTVAGKNGDKYTVEIANAQSGKTGKVTLTVKGTAAAGDKDKDKDKDKDTDKVALTITGSDENNYVYLKSDSKKTALKSGDKVDKDAEIVVVLGEGMTCKVGDADKADKAEVKITAATTIVFR